MSGTGQKILFSIISRECSSSLSDHCFDLDRNTSEYSYVYVIWYRDEIFQIYGFSKAEKILMLLKIHNKKDFIFSCLHNYVLFTIIIMIKRRRKRRSRRTYEGKSEKYMRQHLKLSLLWIVSLGLPFYKITLGIPDNIRNAQVLAIFGTTHELRKVFCL